MCFFYEILTSGPQDTHEDNARVFFFLFSFFFSNLFTTNPNQGGSDISGGNQIFFGGIRYFLGG